MPAAAGEMRRPNLPRGCVDDLQRGLGCVELIAQLSPPGVSDKKPSTFVDVAFHPLKPWVAAIEPKGCGVVWDYDTGEVVTEFDLGESQVLDDEELHGSEPGDEAAAEVDPVGNYNLSTTPKGLLSRASASASSRAVQGAVVAGTNAVAAAKGIMSPSGASIIKRRRTTLNMLFYDHEAIAYMTQLPAPRTCFDEWLLIVTRAHIVICDLSQNGAVHHLDPEDLHRGLPTSVAILPSGLLAIGCQDGKIRIWNVQQLVLLTTPPIVVKRSGSGVLPGAETRLSTQLHHLACATLDGHVVTWRVSLNASTASCDCVKTFEVELRDVFRSFDTVNGVHELKFHPHHDVMTAACRDGTVFFFDVAPMLDNNKPPTLTGLVPNSKLQSVLVLPSVQKGGFQVLSMAPLNSTLLISEVGVKGRYGGKDNVPTIFTEFTTTNSQESRDLRGFVTPMPPKRLKLVSLTTSVRHPGELCCLTNYGLLVLRITCLASPKPVFIPRGLQSAPAIGFPSSMIIGLRLLGEDPQMKPQFQMIQNNGETSGTIERLRVPDLHYHSWQHGFLAAIVPVSGHLEIFQLGLKPVPPKAVDLETIFVAHAFGFAWHPSQPLFAVLAPNKELSGKITRSNTASAIVPSRRSRFFFGGNRTSAAAANDEADTRQQRAATRSLTLSIYKLTGDDAEVEFLETSFLSGEDHVLHIFPGPLLGVVKFVAPADTSSIFPAGATTILGVRDEKLVLGGPLHAVHILDLSNRLLQCAMLVTAGSIDQAAQLAQSLSPDATQWLGAVFEAFGHAEAALRLLPGLSLELKVNMCIKHTLLEPLSRLLNEVVADKQQRDSTNLTGSSLFQRSCIALHRGGTETLLKQLGSSLLAQKRYNDAIFVASLLQNDEQLIQAYGSAGEWGAAFHVAKGKTASTRPPSVTPIQNAILQKWNASVAKPTANWRTVLEKQDIRPPTTLKLAAPSK
ncbi:hypothetical protein PHYBOEH_003594 [Phytophthora boehmeriae]|uniref:Uncharacterized protein n=1 Tax=Phytophthora boehmeriae TaxID=109152 RepID=A0A8T1X6P3_9STRA|nr:hypothetical protein PHYBOEH_003594 [Phytophthora boehmeriae]